MAQSAKRKIGCCEETRKRKSDEGIYLLNFFQAIDDISYELATSKTDKSVFCFKAATEIFD
jgi:hypothetical protein